MIKSQFVAALNTTPLSSLMFCFLHKLTKPTLFHSSHVYVLMVLTGNISVRFHLGLLTDRGSFEVPF